MTFWKALFQRFPPGERASGSRAGVGDFERALLAAQSTAVEEFYEKYFDERGYLKCIPRWGGNDGPDDAIENLWHWPALYVLGGSDSIMEMCKLAWEGHVGKLLGDLVWSMS